MQLVITERTAGNVNVDVTCKPLLDLDPDRDAKLLDVADTDVGMAKLRLRLADRAGPAYTVEVSRRRTPQPLAIRTPDFIVDVVLTQRFGVGVES